MTFAAPADAAPGSAVCRSIEAQLARGGSSNSRYSAAAQKQVREMAKVRQQMAAAGCGMFSTSAQCTRLSRIASRMSANLNTLSARSGSGRSRNQLLADLNANDCRAVRRNPVTVAGEKAESVVTRLFGGRDGDRPA
ncbi:hypothetical protein BMB17_005615, partial [Escherichia coli]|nr:hypothetical protein [Escherichia coli]